VILGRVATIYYFFHFLILLPILGKLERPRPLPTSIAAAVLRPVPATSGKMEHA
jgi:ubiquinol-cytochrome c reductase cytochrome b/c1 subunit